MDGSDTKNTPIAAYKAAIDAFGASGEGSVTLLPEGLIWDGGFGRDALALAEAEELDFRDSAVTVVTSRGPARFSRLGGQGQWFYRELLDAYDQMVKKAFGLRRQPEQVFTGRLGGSEGHSRDGVSIELFPDCLCLLPGNAMGRCLPYGCIASLKREGFALELKMRTGESYVLSMLGLELEPLEKQIASRLKARRDGDGELIRALGADLPFAEAVRASGLFREGAALPLASLPAGLREALEKKLLNSKMAEYLPALKALGRPELMALGVKELPQETVEELKAQLLASLQAGEAPPEGLTAEQEDALRWALWLVVPGADGSAALVELAIPGQDAATYAFRTADGFESFLNRLDLGLALTGLERSVFSLSAEELARPENQDLRLLLRRSPALTALREQYIGKAIHRGLSSWRLAAEKLLAPQPAVEAEGRAQRFCTQCGAKLAPGPRFCTQCGARL